MMKGRELCDAYLSEIRRVHGDGCADKSQVYYSKGWYYVKIAQKAPDGSWGTWGIASPFRAHDIIARVSALRGRVDCATRESRLALTGEVKLAHHISVERVWREDTDDYQVRLSVPSRLIKNVLDMRGFKETIIEAVRIAEVMENE